MEKQQGPTILTIPELVIPETTLIMCSGCTYYQHNLRKSGNHPIYADICTHPTIEPVSVYDMIGNLHCKNKNGMIETPEWCPFLKQEEKI